jgi:hypothetical protein
MTTANTKRNENKSSNDLYTTPKEALAAIWPHVVKDMKGIYMATNDVKILEPCAGLLDIVSFIEDEIDFKVYTNDLHPVKGYWYDYHENFLGDNAIEDTFDIIITNPPYNKAVEFVLKGFEHAPIQWHFLRLSFLEGQDRHNRLMRLGKLTDVYVFTYRVSCPKGVEREPSANSVCYAWYRFDRHYNGVPKLHWLTK